jgi:hypothetical protein
MGQFLVVALLLAGLTVPIVLFVVLLSRSRLHPLFAAAVAVAAGWLLNVAWAFAVQETAAKDASNAEAGTLAIALGFGWVCPTVLVFLAWLVRRFMASRSR